MPESGHTFEFRNPLNNFERAVQIVLVEEGVFSNHSWDPGGKTKYGIAQKYHPNIDVEKLTVPEAIELYRTEYWEGLHCQHLPWAIAFPVFDCAVNQGIDACPRLLQVSIQEVGNFKPELKIDGNIGPRTLTALNRILRKNSDEGELELFKRFMANRVWAYSQLGNWQVCGKGWAYRLFNVSLELFDSTPSEAVDEPDTGPTNPPATS